MARSKRNWANAIYNRIIAQPAKHPFWVYYFYGTRTKSNEMKNTLSIIFQVLLGIVLLGKISNWFLDYSDETNQMLSTAMFTLIGVAYLVGGFPRNKKLTSVIFLICGVYLIAMNFMSDFELKSILAVVCILTPMLIARFSSKESDDEELAEN